MMRLILILAILLSACASSTQKTYLVKDLEGNVYDGQHIRVFGYIHIEFENQQMGYSELDAACFWRTGPWLDMNWQCDKRMGAWGMVEGTVDLTNKGHFGAFPFSLKDVKIIKKYHNYNPDLSKIETILKILGNVDKEKFLEGELDTLKSITGKDIGTSPVEWSWWFFDVDNDWRSNYIDSIISLPNK